MNYSNDLRSVTGRNDGDFQHFLLCYQLHGWNYAQLTGLRTSFSLESDCNTRQFYYVGLSVAVATLRDQCSINL
jgi:hypothetical protein